MTLLQNFFLSFLFVLNSPSTGEISGRAQIEPWNRYKIELSGNSIICDGQTLYLIDNSSREIYIQPSQPLDSSQFPDLSALPTSYEGTYTDPATSSEFSYTIRDITSSSIMPDSSFFKVRPEDYDQTWVITDLR